MIQVQHCFMNTLKEIAEANDENSIVLSLRTMKDNFKRLERSYQITCKNLEEKTKQVSRRNMQIKELKKQLQEKEIRRYSDGAPRHD